MIEQDAVRRVYAIGLAVIDRDPIGIKLRRRVRRAGIERRRFLLRDLPHLAEQLGGRGLIEASLVFRPRIRIASSKRSVPSPSALAVYSGVSNDTCTCDCAARLSISSGCVSCTMRMILVAS